MVAIFLTACLMVVLQPSGSMAEILLFNLVFHDRVILSVFQYWNLYSE